MIGWSAAVALGVLLAAFVMFALGLIGGGDAKLAAVTALWLGIDYTPAYLIYTALLGGAFALLILLFRSLPTSGSISRMQAGSQGSTRPAPACPMGLPMAAAALIVFLRTPWMANIT